MLSYCNKVMTTTIMMNLLFKQEVNENLAVEEIPTQLTYTMLRSMRVIEVITHNITFPRITFRILLPRVARCEVVNCRMGNVTWFYFLANHVNSSLCIPHFPFRIPHFRILPIPVAACIASSPITA